MSDLLVPLLMIAIAVFALVKRQDVYPALLAGGAEGLRLLASIAPALVMLMTAVRMLEASGALAMLTRFLTPTARLFGIPPETLPLALLRPFSGSAALAVGAELMCVHGVDSLIGRTAAVMLGSTETTFYTISVYFGAVGVKKTRYTVPAALLADLTGFTMAALSVRLFG